MSSSTTTRRGRANAGERVRWTEVETKPFFMTSEFLFTQSQRWRCSSRRSATIRSTLARSGIYRFR